MISKLTGKIAHKTTNWLILEANGIGYKVFCNVGALNTTGNLILFTHHHIREDQQALYGFATLAELELFELLITVNGVGPKAAMTIMSSSQSDRIVNAIAQGDTAVFKAVSGIGPKVAAKIIVELKNKVGGIGGYDLAGFDASDEVADALETLGYKRPEIAAILKDMPTDLVDAQAKVKWALKAMTRQ